MKKIIAISVMFALIAGAVFADPSIGGEYGAKAILLEDKGGGDDARAGGFGFASAHANVKWEGENAGGMIRLFSTSEGYKYGSIAWYTPDFAFAWWKPVDQLRFQIGRNPDGDWGHAQITGWGFQAEAQNYVAIAGGFIGAFKDVAQYLDIYALWVAAGGTAANLDEEKEITLPDGSKKTVKGKAPGVPLLAYTAESTGFWGGFGAQGITLQITPVDGVEIDLGIPMSGENPAAVTYANTKINIKADIPDIGTARVAFDLKKADKKADQLADIYLAFYLTAIENMTAEVGIGIVTSGLSDKKNDQFQIGLGYTLDAGDLGLKARLGVVPKVSGADGLKDYIPFGLNIMPYYNLGSLTAYVNFGVGTMLKVTKGDKAGDYLDFYFNPYVKIPVNMGNFYAGFKFSQGSKGLANWVNTTGADAKKPDASWAIPIGFQVYF